MALSRRSQPFGVRGPCCLVVLGHVADQELQAIAVGVLMLAPQQVIDLLLLQSKGNVLRYLCLHLHAHVCLVSASGHGLACMSVHFWLQAHRITFNNVSPLVVPMSVRPSVRPMWPLTVLASGQTCALQSSVAGPHSHIASGL